MNLDHDTCYDCPVATQDLVHQVPLRGRVHTHVIGFILIWFLGFELPVRTPLTTGVAKTNFGGGSESLILQN